MTTVALGAIEQTTLQVTAACVAFTQAGGPALAAPLDPGLALTVTAREGSPISGLGLDHFAVSVLATDRGGAKSCAVPVVHVSEPLAGVYVIALDAVITRRMHGCFACVVEVRLDAGEPAHRDHRVAATSRVLVAMTG